MLYALHCHLRRNLYVEKLKNRQRLKIVSGLKAKGRIVPVDRVKDISASDFRRLYLDPGIPVLLESAAKSWPCSSRWTFEFLREYCGNQPVKITQREGVTTEKPVSDKEYSHEMLFREYLDQYMHDGKTYLRFSSLLESFPELLQDLDLSYLKQLRSSHRGAWVQAFVGAKGTKTPFHAAISAGIFINVVGIKRWKFIPAHYNAILNPSPNAMECSGTN